MPREKRDRSVDSNCKLDKRQKRAEIDTKAKQKVAKPAAKHGREAKQKVTKPAAKHGTKAKQKVAKPAAKHGTKAKQKVARKKAQEEKAVNEQSTPARMTSWMFDLLIDAQWRSKLTASFQADYFKHMESWILKQYNEHEVFPSKQLIFNAFNSIPFNNAHGLSFSVPRGVAIPPSLKNIYKELASDIPGFSVPSHGCLENWASQGVLLLNAALTVQAHEANSHARCGWWKFTDDVIRTISNHSNHCVFILWGGFAHKKEPLIDATRHRIIKTAHPSPLSFNKFRDCKCFSTANEKLRELGRGPVDWTVHP